MTQETKIVFDLDDITNIRVICGTEDCGGEIVIPVEGGKSAPHECPCCLTRWRNGGANSEFEFISTLRHLAGKLGGKIKLKLEINRPDSE